MRPPAAMPRVDFLRDAPSGHTEERAAPVVFDVRLGTGSGRVQLNAPRFLDRLGYRMLCGYLLPPGDAGHADLRQKAERLAAPTAGPNDTLPAGESA